VPVLHDMKFVIKEGRLLIHHYGNAVLDGSRETRLSASNHAIAGGEPRVGVRTDEVLLHKPFEIGSRDSRSGHALLLLMRLQVLNVIPEV
jgi:hypothetical protein